MHISAITSTAFPVNDLPTFIDFCDFLGVELFEEDVDGQTLYGFRAGQVDVDDDELEMLAEHLPDGVVAIIQQVGIDEDLRVFGSALAINNQGKTNTVTLDDILFVARDLGDYPGRYHSC